MKKKQNTSFCPVHIPQEITVQVLARLPAKSLMRFKCVCKLWESTICDPEFGQSHHTFSRTRPDGNYFVTLWYFCVQNRVSISFKDVHGKSKVPPPIELQIKEYQLLHRDVAATEPLDGLICLYTMGMISHVSVLNISTRQIVHLPKVGVDRLSHYSLGFDPVSRDYKVLKLRRSDDNLHVYDPRIEFKIYTLGTSSWRKVEVQCKSITTLWMNSSSTCVNGTIFWLSAKVNCSTYTYLTAFDVRDEVFRHMILTPSGPENYGRLFSIGGKLAATRVNIGENLLDFGFLEENEKNQVLEKDYTGFSPDIQKTEGLRISGVSNKGELILVDDRLSRNFYFDLKTRRCREEQLQWPNPDSCCTSIGKKLRYYHVENIVRLKDHDSASNHDDNFFIA